MQENGKDMCLWRPDVRKKTKIDEFREIVNQKYSTSLGDYHELYKWSVEEYAHFWETWWEFGRFVYSSPPTQIVDMSLSITQVPKWFSGARLNFAENLLRFRDDRVAIYATGEGQPNISNVTYKELYKQVGIYARALKGHGVKNGDRVVGYLPNSPAAVKAMLGTASLGAVWSSTSPDFGVTVIL
ncbi:acetoacetyl-CoA synthetase-like [Homarus americanus]|uniref:acetoacetyl-CoA synthetase-like n=1 Tax=Homarus americanus TaxID=6706 RepID=UPI001C457D5D|nr:acetoacetyl-CoA synthetase-like [Homarus americanus]